MILSFRDTVGTFRQVDADEAYFLPLVKSGNWYQLIRDIESLVGVQATRPILASIK